jgi:uncharacterized protein
MEEGTGILPGLPAVAGKPVHVGFDGGRPTSDGGMLLLAAVEQRLKIAERLVAGKGQRSQLQLLTLRLCSRMALLRASTALHLFVVTLQCEHSGPYCQVSRRSADRECFDMSEKLALRAIDVALSAPAPRIKIESPGDEPLLNFPLVHKMFAATQERAPARGKSVEFVIALNHALLSDEVLEFCRDNDMLLSTSLDGPDHYESIGYSVRA